MFKDFCEFAIDDVLLVRAKVPMGEAYMLTVWNCF